jgi:hypothetical protein
MLKTPVVEVPFGTKIIEREVQIFFEELQRHYSRMKTNPKYKTVEIKDNKLFQGGRSIKLNGHTLTSQFINNPDNGATICILSLAVYDIWFNNENLSLDKNGFPAVFEVNENQKKYDHYLLYLDDKGKLVWTEETKKTSELSTMDLAKEWIDLLEKIA